MEITHVIQARIARTQGTHRCHCGQGAQFMYSCYEVYTNCQMNKAKFDARLLGAEHVAKRSPVNDVIYEATLREQRHGLPVEHMVSYDCFACLASLMSQGMNIDHYGEIVLSQLLSKEAFWIMRDVAAPDRWATFKTLHHDVARLLEELRRAKTVQIWEL